MPQGSKLGPWLFLLMINDLRSDPIFQLWKYIDDTTLSECIQKGSQRSIQTAVDQIQLWANTNRFQLHPTKTKEHRFDFSGQKQNIAPIQVGGKDVEVVDKAKLLGLIISSNLKWNAHVDHVLSKASKIIYSLI